MRAKGRKKLSLLTMALLLLLSSKLYAVELLIDGSGQLIGAKNVLVLEDYYDVSFVEDTAWDLWHGTTDWDFDFTDSIHASAASQALLDQVFKDTPSGQYDSDPTLTRGIAAGLLAGWIVTPYDVKTYDYGNGMYDSVLVVSWAMNAYIEEDDRVEDAGQCNFLDDSTLIPFLSFAVWSEAASPVPEPGTMLLLGTGLLGILGVTRRKLKK